MVDLLPMELPRRVVPPMDITYAAGFFDGEGFVGLGRTVPQRVIRAIVVVNNTDIGPLHWLAERWGGQVYKFRGIVKGHRRKSWQWVLTKGSLQAAFLEDVRPYLQIKGPPADLALALLRLKEERGHQRSWTPAQRAQQEALYQTYRNMRMERHPGTLHLVAE